MESHDLLEMTGDKFNTMVNNSVLMSAYSHNMMPPPLPIDPVAAGQSKKYPQAPNATFSHEPATSTLNL